MCPAAACAPRARAIMSGGELAQSQRVHVVAGVLRAMADDYGALALIEAAPARGRRQGAIRVSVLDEGHATGRAFALAVAR